MTGKSAGILLASITLASLLWLSWTVRPEGVAQVLENQSQSGSQAASVPSSGWLEAGPSEQADAGGGPSIERRSPDVGDTAEVSIELHLADGSKISDPGGWITIRRSHASSSTRTGVVDGRALIPLRAKTESTVEPTAGTLNDVPVTFILSTLRLIAGRVAKLDAYEGAARRLHVLDGESEEPLQAIRLSRSSPSSLNLSDPNQLPALLDPGRNWPSPLSIPTMCWGERLWIGAPGYAWKEVDLASLPGREGVIHLFPEGTLVVEVQPTTDLPGVALRVSRLGPDVASTVHQGPLRDLPRGATGALEPAGGFDASTRQITLTGLQPGRYRVSAIGSHAWDHLVAETETTVGAGEVQHVTLDLGPVNQTRVRTHVMMTLPDPLAFVETLLGEPLYLAITPNNGTALRNGAHTMYMSRVGEMLRLDAEGLRFEHRLSGGLPRGQYAVSLISLGRVGVFQIEGEEIIEVKLDVARIAETKIVASAFSGEEPGSSVTTTASVRIGDVWAAVHVVQETEVSAWAYSLPGTLRLQSRIGGKVAVTEVEVHPGKNLITIEPAQRYSAVFRTVKNGVPHSTPLEWWAGLVFGRKGGETDPLEIEFTDLDIRTMTSGSVRVWVPSAGNYRVSVPSSAEFPWKASGSARFSMTDQRTDLVLLPGD